MSVDAIISRQPLGFQWPTIDPFLFCAHHDDRYPAGNGRFGPAASLDGREIGNDFDGRDGWRMYHGSDVPGFPAHPHRGFETVTIVRRGLIDHADSLGAAARFGHGDVQWLTTGKGIVHSEMFPLLDRERDNPLELFQIWLNLPAAGKMVEPHFTMSWSEDVPSRVTADAAGRTTEVVSIAGRLAGLSALAPPPDSWAARADADVAIATIRLAAHARWTLPAADGVRTRRILYFFSGALVTVDGVSVSSHAALELRADARVELVNGGADSEFLLLQGRPIDEPVVQHGPFVMNTRQQIVDTLADYQRTRFGGWPWNDDGPVHRTADGRFARHVDGRIEQRGERLATDAA